MKITMVKTLVNKNRYSFKEGREKYHNYLINKYEEHENLVNDILTELAAKYNILWTGTREHIYHRHNNGYEDNFIIITEIHYESKI